MIFTVGGIKGGTGKTTVATNLTVWLAKQNTDVLLIDADDQETSTDFYTWRTQTLPDPGFTSIKLTGDAIRSNIQKMKSKYDHIVIDTGGRDTTSQRSALVASDVYLLPFQPRSLDVWTITKVDKLLSEIRSVKPDPLIAIGFLNRADVRSQDNRETIQFFQEYPSVTFLDEQLSNRKAFSNAAGSGLSVLELSPIDDKAIKELNQLFTSVTNEVVKQLNK